MVKSSIKLSNEKTTPKNMPDKKGISKGKNGFSDIKKVFFIFKTDSAFAA